MMLTFRLLPLAVIFSLAAAAQEPLYDYVFFANSRMDKDYFFSAATSSGASFIANNNGKLPVSETIFHTPGNALKLEYVNAKNGKWNAAVYKPEFRGQDHFTKPVFLSFWYLITTENTDENELPAFSLIYNDSTVSGKAGIEQPVKNKWTRAVISLSAFSARQLTDPAGVMGINISQAGSGGKKQTIYLDDIEFLQDTNSIAVNTAPSISEVKAYAMHVDIKWDAVSNSHVKYVQVYASEDGREYKPAGIQPAAINRYAAWVGETGKKLYYKIAFLNNAYEASPLSAAVEAATRPMTDDELLTMVQEASFRYYWEAPEAISGLAKENIPGRHNMIATGASGFGIMALVAGTERNFITRAEAVERFQQVVSFLENCETFHGAYPHFIDGPTGRVETFFGTRDNGGDLVETSFLMQGLLAAKAYFNAADSKEKMIRDKITHIWNRVEWSWYKHYPASKFLYWHWSPDQGWIINHNLIGWNETMVTYLLAIASPTYGVDAGMYYTGWANQDSTGQKYRSGWGGTKEGAMYTNGNTYFGIRLDVGVSNGGPLFFTHYSYLGYDPHALTDKYTNYFNNNRNIALINHRYCMQNPGGYKGYGDSCWGLTASDGPYHYSANEPVLKRDKGIIAPTGALSSFPYTPQESMKALKNYYYRYGKFLWGEYGFRDAFNLTQNWCSDIYMGLNQAPVTVMIENYRSGLLWKLFATDADVQNGLKKLDDETKRISNSSK